MGSTATDAAIIPANVTVPGTEAVDALVALLQAEKIFDRFVAAYFADDEDPDDLARFREALNSAICDVHYATLGAMYRKCDLGTEEANCMCAACNGDTLEAATPIYRVIVQRAAADLIETN